MECKTCLLSLQSFFYCQFDDVNNPNFALYYCCAVECYLFDKAAANASQDGATN